MPIKRSIHSEVEPEKIIPTTRDNNKLIKILLILLVVTVIGLVSVLFSYYNTSKKLRSLSTTAGQKEATKKEIDELVKKISKLIVLPTDETPTLATITDATGLAKSQSFYLGSNNGDKVLIYFKAQKAYIYNPNKDILVNVGPVYIEQGGKTASSTDNTTQTTLLQETLSIEIRNGTAKAGLGNETSSKLSSDKSYSITKVIDAATTTYKSNILVDLTNGQKSSLLSKLEKDLNLTATGTIPSGEKSSQSDVLLIVAQ